MSKKWYFYIAILTTVIYLSSGFRSFSSGYFNWLPTAQNKEIYALPSLEEKDYEPNGVPFTGKFFIGFKEALGFRESQCQYRKVNTLGYLGKYQFGPAALSTIGIDNHSKFLGNPKLQEKAFVALLSKNKWELRKEIGNFSGKIIGGVLITESGILAAAHLGGVGSVKKFLSTYGARKCRDCYGTSIASYIREFGGYQTNAIIADSSAKAM